MFSPFFSFLNVYFFNIDRFHLSVNMILVVLVVFLLLFITTSYFTLLKNELVHYSVYVFVYSKFHVFIYNLIFGLIGKNGLSYFGFLFYLWFFIFFFNVLGLLPFSFTLASHFSLAISLSFSAWFGFVYILINSRSMRYFSHFFFLGISVGLACFIALTEVISFVFRGVSLGLRLFANLVAGHVLLHLFSGLILDILYETMVKYQLVFFLVIILLMALLTFLYIFESIVAFLQSYIFLLLICIYLKEALAVFKPNKYKNLRDVTLFKGEILYRYYNREEFTLFKLEKKLVNPSHWRGRLLTIDGFNENTLKQLYAYANVKEVIHFDNELIDKKRLEEIIEQYRRKQ